MRRGIILFFLLLPAAGPADEPPPAEPIPWIHDGLTIPDNETYGNNATSRRPPSEALDEALALAKKENRMLLWYVPRIAGRHMYRAHVTDRYTRIAFFHHPEVVSMVRTNFVPLRAMIDRDLGENIGVTAPEVVEPAVLFVAPEGEILHRIDRIRTWHPDWFLEASRMILLEHARLLPPAEGNADALIRAGRYEEALDLDPGPYHRAVIARRTLRGNEALPFLKDLQSPEAAVERGRVLLGEGDFEGARQALTGLPDTPQALYYLGVLETWAGRDSDARNAWERLIEEDPTGPWSRMARAELEIGPDGTPIGAVSHMMMSPFRKPADRHSPLSSSTAFPRSPEKAGEVTDEALEWLLRTQRSDGAWKDARYAWWPGPEIMPNVHVAVTALAATALLEWRDRRPERIETAVNRALTWLADDSRIARGINEEVFADLFRLRLHLLRAGIEKNEEEQKAPLKISNDLLTSLGTLQNGEGFWGHEYPNPFVTAAVLRTLLDARESGLPVPKETIRKAADALEATRGSEGDQAYMAGRRPSGLKDSAGRMPLCDSVLIRCDRLPADALPKALGNFWKHRESLERIRVCDFHADGQLAGFFLWFDLMETMAVISRLPETDAAPHRRKMLEWICAIPEMDGSFIDSHELGKSYATAAALITLKAMK